MMAEDEDVNDDVMFHVHGERGHDVFRPSSNYRVYRDADDADDDASTSDDADGYHDDLPHDHISRPLMPPRQRPFVRVKQRQGPAPSRVERVAWPLVYLFIFVAAMAAFVCLIIYVIDVYTNRLILAEKGRTHGAGAGSGDQDNLTVIGCSELSVEDVWLIGLPKLLTESAFRLVDVNQDGTLDVVFGFATGADKLKADPLVCDIYFNGTRPCGGGILALDGATGVKLWEHRASHEIFSLNCAQDLNGDGVNDCIGGGRAGTFQAASGRDGSLLWKFNDSSLNSVMNAYTGQYVGDLDDDGVPDIVNIHGGDPLGEPGSSTRLVGKLMLFSGRTGGVISWLPVPEGRESYYSPVTYRRKDGTDYVLFGTGGETHSGALWLITLRDLEKGVLEKAIPLYRDDSKGIMTPPLLLDLNKDGTEDIVFATFNSTVLALDGESYRTLWNFSYPSSETYATPAAGFYNDDDIPDFLIRWQAGPGFPIYYHSIMTILDGATGRPLVTPYPRDSVGAQTSPLTLSAEGAGNDIFLYWISDCHGRQNKPEQFSFLKGTNVHEQSRADFCRLRFKTAGFSKMMAVSERIKSPGQAVYNSEERYHVEREAWVNTTALAQQFLLTHPKYRQDYRQWKAWVAAQQSKWREKDKLRKAKMNEANKGQETQSGRGKQSFSSKKQLPEAIRKVTGRDYEYFHRNDNQNEDDEIPAYDDQDLREKITSIVSELLDRADTLEGGGNPIDRNAGGLKEIEKRLKPGSAEVSLNEGLPNAHSKDTNSLDAKSPGGVFAGWRSRHHPTSGAMDEQMKAGWGVDEQRLSERGADEQNKSTEREKEAKEQLRQQKLHAKYMESFGRRKRHRKQARRRKRHVGPHDEGGLQRLIATGTLAPPLLDPSHPDYSKSMDVIFATYWFYPAKTKILLPQDEECVKKKMDQETIRFDPRSGYYGMDHDAYEHKVLDECLEESGHTPESGTFESQSTYNPYILHMGQMTVYRLRLKCGCGDEKELRSEGKRCARFLPHEQQQWAAYMGSHGNSHWRPRTHSASPHPAQHR